MATTVGFDVYGTLIDTGGVVATLKTFIGEQAEAFSQTWRSKQLEYAFRRGLMQNYADFAVCTRDALEYSCRYHQQALSDEQKDELLAVYRSLPAFDDVAESLARLQADGHGLYAFSNGSAEAVAGLLDNAGIRSFFRDVVSTEALRSFKPDPGVYCHFLRRAGATGAQAWLVSSNSFDVIGARSAGLKAAWVKRRADAIFDPWGIEPTLTVGNLLELAAELSAHG